MTNNDIHLLTLDTIQKTAGDEIAIIQLTESNETFRGTVEGLLPLFKLGYDHIVYSDLNHVYLLNSIDYYTLCKTVDSYYYDLFNHYEPDDIKLPVFTKEEIDSLLSEPPNSAVDIRKRFPAVRLFYYEIE